MWLLLMSVYMSLCGWILMLHITRDFKEQALLVALIGKKKKQTNKQNTRKHEKTKAVLKVQCAGWVCGSLYVGLMQIFFIIYSKLDFFRD